MLVSVVMAVYNGQQYLQEAIDSILQQTYPDLELIIVNDASTDATEEILGQISDTRVQVVTLTENRGGAYALDYGISVAKGEWIAIHDADDVSEPQRLTEQVGYLEQHPGLVAVGSFITCIPGGEQPIAQEELQKFESTMNSFQSRKKIKAALYNCIPLIHGTIIFSKKAYQAAGGYDPQVSIVYDYDLWTRLIQVGDIENVPLKLYRYRRYAESLSNKDPAKMQGEKVQVFVKHLVNTCFIELKKAPVLVVYGTEAGVQSFESWAKGYVQIQKAIFKREKSSLAQVIGALKSKKIDGVVILTSSPYKIFLRQQLRQKGFKRNREVFIFYSRI